MCCRVSTEPQVSGDVFAVADELLRIGLFTPGTGEHNNYWHRDMGDGTGVHAQVDHQGRLVVWLSPSITSNSGHAHHRMSGGIMFEIAAKYAEKVNGIISQHGLVVPCQRELQPDHPNYNHQPIAIYPETPLMYPNICPGFRDLFVSNL